MLSLLPSDLSFLGLPGLALVDLGSLEPLSLGFRSYRCAILVAHQRVLLGCVTGYNISNGVLTVLSSVLYALALIQDYKIF